MKEKKNASILFILLTVLHFRSAIAVVQTAAIDVDTRDGTPYSFLVSQASFGKGVPKKELSKKYQLALPPGTNPLLCNNATSTEDKSSLMGKIVMVPRGVCTFEHKAYIAQTLGAKAILVFGTLASRYSLNETKSINQTDYKYSVDDIIYPQKSYDYDCNKGRAEIPATSIELEPLPYNAIHNDPILSGSTDENLCKLHSNDKLQNCPSQACLLTGNTTSEGNNNKEKITEACCAWDLHIWLYSDNAFKLDTVHIPAAYVTVQQASRLLSDLKKNQRVEVSFYSRYRPEYNSSSGLIWALGVAACALAAYLSASDYRKLIDLAVQRDLFQIVESDHNTDNRHASNSGEDDERSVRSRSRSPQAIRRSEEVVQEAGTDERITSFSAQNNEETLELTAYHAFGFIIMSSSALFILFYFKIYGVVKVMYGIGTSKAISQIVFDPALRVISRVVGCRDYIIWRTKIEDIGNISVIDIISHLIGYTLGITWIIMCFTMRHPEENLFFWVMQDVMGVSMCITFLETIKLNSIRVASILLTVAFFYDIFFVFLTPYLFKGESIMVTVATSGGPPKADPAWCEKYPDDADCQGGNPLPMLLTIPRIGDYMGGSSLLGLGDIVLPGLLLSFAARYDTAKSLLGIIRGGNGSVISYSCPEQKFCGDCGFCSGGYFRPLVVAYAIGLLMANTAVYVMEMGQPALLYLVPTCLGTMIFLGWRRKELQSLWDGPRIIRTADQMIYEAIERNLVVSEHVPLATAEEDAEEVNIPVPSASDPNDRNPSALS